MHMKICFAVAFFASCLLLQGSAQERRIKLCNGELVSEKDYFESIRLIDKISKNVGPDAYRKYTDGSVSYVGKLLMMRFGVLPLVNTNEMHLVSQGYKVHDVSSEGCRITALSTKDFDPQYDIFVLALAAYSDREYANVLMLRKVGSFKYTTTGGGSRIIPKYEMGERITKEEYLSGIAGKLKCAPDKHLKKTEA
jgi:hypothetical protein